MILLTPYGYREWLLLTVLAAMAAAVAIVLLPIPAGLWVALGIGIVWLALLSFFRDPIRFLPKNLRPGDMLSPADGVVSAIEHVDLHDAITGGGPAVIIRIFLSVLNVHVNRAPCDATVEALKYTPGKFLNAQTEESARCNECNLITLRIESNGVREAIGIRQVSGMLARRIVCAVKVGDSLKRGQKFGMIKFGSTTELILPRPDDVTLHVKKGDRVKGGVTVLATLTPLEERLIDATREAQRH